MEKKANHFLGKKQTTTFTLIDINDKNHRNDKQITFWVKSKLLFTLIDINDKRHKKTEK